ncbi:MAG: hypothetical protein ACFHX7_00245 [Pseudomonadota bacterium]
MSSAQLLLLGLIAWAIMGLGAYVEDAGYDDVGYVVAIFGALLFFAVLFAGVFGFRKRNETKD